VCRWCSKLNFGKTAFAGFGTKAYNYSTVNQMNNSMSNDIKPVAMSIAQGGESLVGLPRIRLRHYPRKSLDPRHQNPRHQTRHPYEDVASYVSPLCCRRHCWPGAK